MQATDLLHPGDFHQVTQQIRELVAYAISQLENAEADGSLPSGKFAAFLIDAAQKTPGFVDGETGLAPHQSLLEDGQTIQVNGHDVIVSVAGSHITSAKLKADNVRILQHGDQCWNKVGFRTISAQINFDSSTVNAVSTMPNAAIVVDGEEHPMHDQGGHAGRITAKVTANNVVDMVFTTPGSHILRDGDKYQIGRAGGPAEVVAAIAADRTVTFTLADADQAVVGRGSSVFLGRNPESVGTLLAINADGTLRAAAAGFLTHKSTAAVRIVNAGDTQANYAEANTVSDGSDRLGNNVLRGTHRVLTSGKVFYTDTGSYIPTIVAGKITKLESAS